MSQGNSYEAGIIDHRRKLRNAIKTVNKTTGKMEEEARLAMEAAAVHLLRVQGRWVSGYCQEAGEALFTARTAWYDRSKEIHEPIDWQGAARHVTKTAMQAIDKWFREFYYPYKETFGLGFMPFKAVAHLEKVRGLYRVRIETTREW